MGGSRHSKNAGTMGSEAMTYAEMRGRAFGTVQERLGKDSVGNYNDCRLTLRTVEDPVCTPHGYLYSREAILESLLEQKKNNKRKLMAWQAQQDVEVQKAEERAMVEQQTKLLAFDRQNHMGASDTIANSISQAIKAEAEEMLNEKKVVASALNIQESANRMKEMKAFWLPSKTPEARQLLERPEVETLCPASGKKLRLKDLITVNFTHVGEGESGYAMDPVTRDTFTNASRLVVLKPTGDVVLWETYQKCIKPDGAYNGVSIAERDVVELQKGGTGFARHDGKAIKAQKHWALGPGSGRADLRGQHQGAVSKGGLVFRN